MNTMFCLPQVSVIWCCSHRGMRGDRKYYYWVQLADKPLFAWHAANKASQLEQAKLVWGHHMTLRWPLHFTSVLIFWAAHMTTFAVANLFMRSWIATAAGILGIFSINLAGCIFPSKTEQLAVCRMRRFFLASPLSLQCSLQLQATVLLLQSYTCH